MVILHLDLMEVGVTVVGKLEDSRCQFGIGPLEEQAEVDAQFRDTRHGLDDAVKGVGGDPEIQPSICVRQSFQGLQQGTDLLHTLATRDRGEDPPEVVRVGRQQSRRRFVVFVAIRAARCLNV